MDSLVQVVSKLNRVLQATGDARLRPPLCVALGAQSSGKSSVIDALIGLDLIPRNTGLCTRCPLEIQLINVDKAVCEGVCAGSQGQGGQTSWWAEFGHMDSRVRFTDPELVKREILAQTERLCGSNKGISASTPIGLALYSPLVPDLVLVDLPGLVKTPQGDQPADIERQIRECWLSYITQPDSLILAVCPATQDLFADDALKTALDVDPTGDRTIGVLTKVDLMDAGTDAREICNGSGGKLLFPLKRGFIPVVGRSQKDLLEGLPLEKALLREKLFFERHPAYRSMSERCGTAHLSRTLSSLVLAAIREWLPRVRGQLALMTQQAEEELRELGPPVSASSLSGASGGTAGEAVLRLLTAYSSNFSAMIEGRTAALSLASSSAALGPTIGGGGGGLDAGGLAGIGGGGGIGSTATQDLLTRQLFGGARLQEHIRSRFSMAVEEWLFSFMRHSSATLPSAEILMALRNSAGLRPTLDVPEDAFVALTRRAIMALRNQGRSFVGHVFDELRRIADTCLPMDLLRFRDLKDRSVEIAHDLLRRNYSPTLESVDRVIEFELAHINTLHPDFCGAEHARRVVAAAEDEVLFSDPLSPTSKARRGSSNNRREGAADDDVIGGPSSAGSSPGNPANGNPGNSNDNEHDLPTDVRWALKEVGGVWPASSSSSSSSSSPGHGAGAGAGHHNNRRSHRQNSHSDNDDGAAAGSPNGIALDATFHQQQPYNARRRGAGGRGGGADEEDEDDGEDDFRGNGAGDRNGGHYNRSRHQRHQHQHQHHQGGYYEAGEGGGAGASGSSSSAAVGGGSGSGSGSGSVASRFKRHIVSDIAGHGPEDPLPPGAIRVGGPHTPFIARPVIDRGASSSEGTNLNNGHGGFGGSRASPSYRHFELLQLPCRPLPATITPADLKPTPEEKVQIRVVRFLVFSYLTIVKKNYQDQVPKLVIALLVKKSQEELSSALIHALYPTLVSNPDGLLKEEANIASKRQRLTERLRLLGEALEVIADIRGATSSSVGSSIKHNHHHHHNHEASPGGGYSGGYYYPTSGISLRSP